MGVRSLLHLRAVAHEAERAVGGGRRPSASLEPLALARGACELCCTRACVHVLRLEPLETTHMLCLLCCLTLWACRASGW